MKSLETIWFEGEEISFGVRENSWLAKLAAWKLNASQLAMVLGNTIHLFKTGREEFLKDEKWLKHELCHIRQFRENGFFMFLTRYLWESMRKGYYNNRFEIEARKAENSGVL